MIALALVALLSAGCGERSPVGIDEVPTLTNVNFIVLTEFDGYIADVRLTIPGVTVMIAEFASIAGDFNAGYVPAYWIGAYTKNLLKRVEGIQVQVQGIRPTHPELLKLHLEEFEASLEDFNIGFGLFVQGIEQPGTVTLDDVNDHIVDGNIHLIRLQILLGDLAGRNVDFFAADNGGDGFDDGFDGTGF